MGLLAKILALDKLHRPRDMHKDTAISYFGNAKSLSRLTKYRIIKCDNPEYWYADKIGDEIEIYHFGTYGTWDKEGRWVDFWDVEKISE